MLRTFLAFKAIAQDPDLTAVDTPAIKKVVEELFTLLPTPAGAQEKRFSGTISLRGRGGQPVWLRNDSYRGSFLDYAGPTSPGRELFQDHAWSNPLEVDAIDRVTDTLTGKGYALPAGDVLAALAMHNRLLDPSLGWSDLIDLARERYGLTPDEWARITTPPMLEVPPFVGPPWEPQNLSPALAPPGTGKAVKSEQPLENFPPELAGQVDRVLDSLAQHGERSIVALAGVAGTSKSYVGRLAARSFASDQCLREVQFSPGYTYEEFIEGPRYAEQMKVTVTPGIFLELNHLALENPGNQYVLLIEELTRADLPRVLGELLTYIEYRGPEDSFTTMYKRDVPTRIASNIAVLTTYNPTDRSAVSVDAALLRRMRVLDFPPNMHLLTEILTENGVDSQVTDELVAMFEFCNEQTGADRFNEIMPFGHAVFAGVESESDLHDLWHQELKRILIRPNAPPHELYDTIAANYPWRDAPDITVVTQSKAAAPQGGKSDLGAADGESDSN
jgi:5-methylcytosine-specific restriction protein B